MATGELAVLEFIIFHRTRACYRQGAEKKKLQGESQILLLI